VDFVERKLADNGVAKVIPPQGLLADVYINIERGRRLEQAIAKLDALDAKGVKPPADLEQRVRKLLEKTPVMRWDAAVEEIANAAAQPGEWSP
jgi:hypothetical protein